MFSYMYCTISCEAYRTVDCRMPTIHLMANLIPDKSKLKYQDYNNRYNINVYFFYSVPLSMLD